MEGRFHLAFATTDLKRIKAFYGSFLGLKEGRSAATWVDYDFFGHQLTIQEVPMMIKTARVYNPQSNVPANHWGVVLNIADWRRLRDKLKKLGIPFHIEPNTVMKGEVGEQRSLFIEDPDGNAIEFKAMLEDGNLFRIGMKSMLDPARIIRELGLQPHPEGGHYREIFRSGSLVTPSDDRDRRSSLTAIHFLLQQGEHSRWHRVRSDEVWHHAGGGAMGLWTLSPDLDRMEYHALGAMEQGASPMHVVPANWWQAAQPVRDHSLCTCLVAPGFDFTDFSFMTEPTQQQAIRVKWPELAFLI